MAPYSSTHAWKIPWTGKPGGLPSMGSHRVRHDLAAAAAALAHMFTIITTEACGDQAIYPRSNRWQITMLTMNPSLFPKALSTPLNCIPWIKSTTYPWTFRISQSMLQKSSSSIVCSEWQLFDYLLDTCILIYLDTYIHVWLSW